MSPSKVFTDLFHATKVTIYFFVFTRGRLIGLTVRREAVDDESKLAEGPLIGVEALDITAEVDLQ